MPGRVAELIIAHDREGTRAVPLGADRVVLTIGRDPQCDVHLDPLEKTVSRHHADLRRTDDGDLLINRSRNGTQVAGRLLGETESYPLQDGDVISIGSYRLTYHILEPVVEPPVVHILQARTPAPAAEESAPEPWFVGSASRYMRFLPALFQLVEEPAPSADGRQNGHSTNGLDGLDTYTSPSQVDPNAFLGRFLRIFEAIWEPLEQRQDYLAMYFDPLTCPETLLPWLATWLDVDIPPRLAVPRKRQLLRTAADLYRLRGTREGLTRMIHACTGVTPKIEDDPDLAFVVRIRLVAQEREVDRQFVDSLIRAHKPAYLGYVLDIRLD